MRIIGLALERGGSDHLTLTVDDDGAWRRPQLGDQSRAVRQTLGRADFFLLPFILEDDALCLALHLHHTAIREVFRAVKREEHISVWQHPTVARRPVKLPFHLTVLPHDHCPIGVADSEKRMPDGGVLGSIGDLRDQGDRTDHQEQEQGMGNRNIADGLLGIHGRGVSTIPL